ncbi:MmcQ/YjbR family DNA-binding protein [Sandaracinus amylolyticus]|uniref:MmcQ/YjbR family DNA-binding protein n=1 Tax=Sandaracinus amylolyticus TaxID=927083 RepID=UPI001F32AC2F|nr:MmcQ/YjbR family DNA-binding protein [Sandaracinus amylolyticus]
MSGQRFRELALSLEGAYEVEHFDRAAFRTKRRIFATLPPDAASANLMFDADTQEAICEALPDSFAPVPGGWGRMGATTVNLRTVSERDLERALRDAHARASEPTKKKTAAKKKRG